MMSILESFETSGSTFGKFCDQVKASPDLNGSVVLACFSSGHSYLATVWQGWTGSKSCHIWLLLDLYKSGLEICPLQSSDMIKVQFLGG